MRVQRKVKDYIFIDYAERSLTQNYFNVLFLPFFCFVCCCLFVLFCFVLFVLFLFLQGTGTFVTKKEHFCKKIENFGNMGHLRNQTGTFATKKTRQF